MSALDLYEPTPDERARERSEAMGAGVLHAPVGESGSSAGSPSPSLDHCGASPSGASLHVCGLPLGHEGACRCHCGSSYQREGRVQPVPADSPAAEYLAASFPLRCPDMKLLRVVAALYPRAVAERRFEYLRQGWGSGSHPYPEVAVRCLHVEGATGATVYTLAESSDEGRCRTCLPELIAGVPTEECPECEGTGRGPIWLGAGHWFRDAGQRRGSAGHWRMLTMEAAAE